MHEHEHEHESEHEHEHEREHEQVPDTNMWTRTSRHLACLFAALRVVGRGAAEHF